VRWAQAATCRVPAALSGGKSLQSFLQGVTCPLESQPMPQVATTWRGPPRKFSHTKPTGGFRR
jgi:hypothetical protein